MSSAVRLTLKDQMNNTNIASANQTPIFRYSEFSDLKALIKYDRQGTWADFVAMIEAPKTYPTKQACPLLVLATFGDQPTASGCLRHADNIETIRGLACDHDAGTLSIKSANETLQLFGIRAVLHTTASSTPDKPRWHAFFPLSRPHAPHERRALIACVNDLLGGVLAPESFTLGQAYYFGRVAGVPYTALESVGGCVDTVLEPVQTRALAIVESDMILPALTDIQLADLKGVLRHLSDHGQADYYPGWSSVGMALKSAARNGREPELRDLWLEFSRGSSRFKDDATALAKWGKLLGTARGIGAIFKKAKELGMANPATARSVAPAMSDMLISRKLADMLAGGFLYEHGGRGWLIYDVGVWRACTKGEEVEAAKQLGSMILKDFIGADDAKRAMALAIRAMSATGIAAALKLAQSDHRLAVRPDAFDTDPDFFNCANGVIHLPTGMLRPHDPALRMSRQCPYDYAPQVSRRWFQFLDEISMNDPEWIDYLHRVCGYVLSGLVKEEVLIFMLGFGANGKSVLANVLNRIMGSYAVSLPSAFLMQSSSRNGEAATPALAMLQGARLALANEVESGAKLSAQTVKVACSTEPIAARHIYGNVFSYLPTHKLVVRGNHKPIITDDDDGIWRRIHLLPFDRRFGPDEKDMQLEARLMSEGSAILYWMVQGSIQYFKRGLVRTGRIAHAAATYRKESDLMGQWISEEVETAPQFDCVQGGAYANYRIWCVNQGLRPMCKKQFTDKLKERGFKTWQQGGGSRARVYRGFKIRNDFSQAQTESDLFQ